MASPVTERTVIAPAPRATGATKRRRFPWFVYLGLLPTFALLGVLAYYPAVSGVYHSFFDWRPGFDSPFVGFDNYRTMFADDLWWDSFKNLGYIFVVSVTVMWVLPLLAAELVISLRSERLQFVFRTLLIAPLAFPGVVTVLVWSFVFDPNDGMLNQGLSAIGLGSLAHNWVGDPSTALASLLLIGFPWVASLPFLVFLTALQNIPKEVYEAASLDGCGRLRRVLTIDLPLMASQIKLLFFLATISVLQFGFAAYLVTGGGPDNATQVPVLRMLGVAFEGSDWGYAATLSTTLFVITALFSGVLVLIRKKENSDARAL
ncbi:sugar ABC transporter permease [Streptomyces sp. NBC_00257]|uniref:carbohydrate ABC transporter permease n=1 Tax=Streptomyces TaxID=1883 RepID=UPI00225228E3|nr:MULTISPECIES: sugar ABC transporter permease [unclassified Streptomyces]WTB58344.1 sugar ABC transporter permease [Streptomyces sp. NBC_00826]WTH88776.1 sugar ABC transporter permease [Streptomyces sp. NBC_00825]WTH97506.1 sugar ABC transporter permease [Streptomyces sp. NBC_00822]MCX4843876.1 sugar ABC transporter permease [Streptomyces sp. NBC_00893]MCX4863024.1 sugar ABC transporter permease [Streptomyces sp. NBC_00906]